MQKIWNIIRTWDLQKVFKRLAFISLSLWGLAAIGIIYSLVTSHKKEALEAKAVQGEGESEAHSSENKSENTEAAHEGAGEEKKNHPAKPEATLREGFSKLSQMDIEAHHKLIEEYYHNKEFENSLPHVERIKEFYSKDKTFLNLSAELYFGAGRFAKALETVDNLKTMKVENAALAAMEVQCLYRLDKQEEAYKQGEESLKKFPRSLEILTALGTIDVEMGKHEGSESHLQQALKINSQYVPALYQLGRQYQMEGNYADAEKLFKTLIPLENSHAKAHGQLGIALYHLNKMNEAEGEFNKALELNTRDYNTWFNLGELYMQQSYITEAGQEIKAYREKALKCFLNTVQYNAYHAQAHFRIGVILNGNSQYKEAIHHLEMALDIDNHHVPTLIQLSLAYENLKQMEQAKNYLTRAFELDPLNKAVIFKLRQLS